MYKVSELTGAALDWAVAKILNPYKNPPFDGESVLHRVFHENIFYPNSPTYEWERYSPSTDWSQGGPIIEREDLSFRKYHNPKSTEHGKYYAQVCRESGSMVQWSKQYCATGETPLIAAMRCYVASKLGDEVEIPEELKNV